MKKILLGGLLTSITFFVFGQNINSIINPAEVQRIEKILSADDMQGRKTFTPGIEKAANFIAGEFKVVGLQTWNANGTYLQDFSLVQTHFISGSVTLDHQAVEMENIIAFTANPDLHITEDSGYTKAFIRPGDNLRAALGKYIQ